MTEELNEEEVPIFPVEVKVAEEVVTDGQLEELNEEEVPIFPVDVKVPEELNDEVVPIFPLELISEEL